MASVGPIAPWSRGLRWDYRGPSGAIDGHRLPIASFQCLLLYIIETRKTLSILQIHNTSIIIYLMRKIRSHLRSTFFWIPE